MGIIFKRKLYDRMLQWKNEENGRSALLINGARRVGKSTLVEEFAKKEYKSYILIDFSIAPKEVHTLFEDISDLNFLLLRLQFIYKTQLEVNNSVIIFDEVQKQPLARQAIKHLVKDGRFHYIETGSLISIKKNTKDIVIPSEETKLTLNPLDYEEFRWALGDTATIPLLKHSFSNNISLGDGVNRKLMRDLRLYMLVGGMPQAIETYIQTNNLSSVDATKRKIIDLYEDDFRKIDSTGRLSKIFDSIPSSLSNHASKLRFGKIGRINKNDELELIADLEDSKTVNIAYHANNPNIGMALSKDIEKYKLYLADTGLFITLAFKDKDFTENIIYEKLLSDKLSADLGFVFENLVSQMLKAIGHELYYYTWPSETSNRNYEIDFIISKKAKICPIEVKSSGYKSHKSLDLFCDKFSSRISDKYLIYTKDFRKDQDIFLLPAYMTPFL